jgi:Tfp pilus assembly protein FimT
MTLSDFGWNKDADMKWFNFTKRRFTLVEMLAALVIMLIIAALAMPAVSKMMGSQGVDGAAGMLQSKLRAVRAYAVANRKAVGIFIFADGAEKRTSFRAVEWIPTVPATAGPPATAQVDGYWQFLADAKIEFLPSGAAVEDPVVYSTSYIEHKPTVNANLLNSGNLADPLTGLSTTSLVTRTIGTSNGWIIGFKPNGQPVIPDPDSATSLCAPTYAAVALRVAAAKLDGAGNLKPKTDKVKSNGTIGADTFEDVDFSILVTDRYSGQVHVIANK